MLCDYPSVTLEDTCFPKHAKCWTPSSCSLPHLGQPVMETYTYTVSVREIMALERHRLFDPLSLKLPKSRCQVWMLSHLDVLGCVTSLPSSHFIIIWVKLQTFESVPELPGSPIDMALPYLCFRSLHSQGCYSQHLGELLPLPVPCPSPPPTLWLFISPAASMSEKLMLKKKNHQINRRISNCILARLN